MIRGTVQGFVCAAILAGAAALSPARALAQQPQHRSHKQLRSLIASAANADDYQKLATYFHYQELLFRAKAQRAIDDYAIHAGKFTMAAKFISRAEVAARLYDHYLFKASESAKLAGRYDGMLTELGVKPDRESVAIVSVKSLQNASTGTK